MHTWPFSCSRLRLPSLKMFIAADVLAGDLRPLLEESQEFKAMLTVSVRKLRRDN